MQDIWRENCDDGYRIPWVPVTHWPHYGALMANKRGMMNPPLRWIGEFGNPLLIGSFLVHSLSLASRVPQI